MKGLSHVGHRLHSRPTGRLLASGRRPSGELRTRCAVRGTEAEDRRFPAGAALPGRIAGATARIR